MYITKKDVSAFKTKHCDENKIISNTLKNHFSKILVDPIYDIGSGLGDISINAFPTRRVVHIDTINYDFFPPSNHTKIVGDFFTFKPVSKVGSLLLCHVQQFLDSDLDQFHSRIRDLSPKKIVIVENDNINSMGKIVRWMKENYPSCNPELTTIGFDDPNRYQLLIKKSLKATVVCKDYATLSIQLHYLVDFPPSFESTKAVAEQLETLLPSPSLPIEQTIRGYKCRII